jgi:hypothetical protein
MLKAGLAPATQTIFRGITEGTEGLYRAGVHVTLLFLRRPGNGKCLMQARAPKALRAGPAKILPPVKRSRKSGWRVPENRVVRKQLVGRE